MRAPREVRVLRAADHGPVLPIVEGEGSARPIVWPGSGAAFRTMHRIELAGGSRTVALKHAMEAAYYVIRGDGVVRDPDERRRRTAAGRLDDLRRARHDLPDRSRQRRDAAARRPLSRRPCPLPEAG